MGGVKLVLLLVLLSVYTRSCSSWTFDDVEKKAAGDGGQLTVEVETGSILATTDAAYVCATLDWYPSDRCSYGSCSWAQAGILTLVSKLYRISSPSPCSFLWHAWLLL